MDATIIDSAPSRGGNRWTGLPVKLVDETIAEYRDRLISWTAVGIAVGGYGVSDIESIVYSERVETAEEDVLATVMVAGFPDARLYASSKT